MEKDVAYRYLLKDALFAAKAVTMLLFGVLKVANLGHLRLKSKL